MYNSLHCYDQRRYQLIHLRATKHCLTYDITQSYLPPDANERAPPILYPNRLVLNSHTSAELTLVLIIYEDGTGVCRLSHIIVATT